MGSEMCIRDRKTVEDTWRDKVPDTNIVSLAGLPSIHSVLKKARLRWAGHFVRMLDTRLPKRLFYGELAEGKRPHKVEKGSVSKRC